MKKSVLFSFLLISLFTKAQVNESYPQAYSYLYRMAQKGIISIQDYILPLDRATIKRTLDTIKVKQGSLSKIEQKELTFFLQDFNDGNSKNSDSTKLVFLRKDDDERFRFFAFKNQQTQLFFDPVFGGEYSSYFGKHNILSYGGARIFGNLGKNFGFNILFRDVTESGDSIDYAKSFSPVTGIVNTSRKNNQLNYSYLNFNIGYKWKNGAISIGKDNLNWGYGIGGKVILSSKAPSFPYIKLEYQPFKWLKFNYFNAWLNSDILDSSRSYSTGTGVYGGYREVYRSKYMAQHSISIIPVKGLDISIGESLVYSDKLDIGYLMPVNFFKLYDQYASGYSLNGGSNSQLFAQISSRNQIKNTHLYLSFFIDELRLSKIFDKVESRNQFAYTIGASKTDLFVHYLTLGIEYTRINPFVYSNIIPAQAYTNSSYLMGDWIGNNADRLCAFANYTPMPKLKVNVYCQFIRKGSQGTLDQQYNQQPQPSFLFGSVFKQTDISAQCSYEYINRLNFFFKIGYQRRVYINPVNVSQSNKELSIGFSYGL